MMETIERYEQKYLISPIIAQRIKERIIPFVQSDQFSENGRYKVLSLYLDGISRPFYQATKDQRSQRLKLRIRTYGDSEVFLEIKRKVRGMIWKSRVKLSLENYKLLFPRKSHKVSRQQRRTSLQYLTPKQLDILNEFLFWQDRYQATPQYWVGYEREGFQSPDGDYARITFDTRIKAKITSNFEIPTQIISDYQTSWRRVDFATHLRSKSADIILELKSERRVPLWMSDLCQQFNLSALGVSKYVLAVDYSDVVSEKYRLSEQLTSQKGHFK
jgi:hypothetical protein